MSENLLGWHQFGGKIIPKRAIEGLANHEPSPTRLQVGQAVKVKLTENNVTTFVDAVVYDFKISKGQAVHYSLAFPADVKETFFLVVDDFNGAGGFAGLSALFGTEETATGSCIYSLQEYAEYFHHLAPTIILPEQEKAVSGSHLRLVNGV
jgi:hypothetical protein